MKDSDGTENQQTRKALREIIKKTLEEPGTRVVNGICLERSQWRATRDPDALLAGVGSMGSASSPMGAEKSFLQQFRADRDSLWRK